MLQQQFAKFHPCVSFSFYTLLILTTILYLNPYVLVISFSCGLLHLLLLRRLSYLLSFFTYAVLGFLFVVLINPLFNHRGLHILFYLPSGNPFTAESVIYGFWSGLMLITVLIWFQAAHLVLSSDKFIYLFGRALPQLALTISMVFRFIPLFKTKLRQISANQSLIHRQFNQDKNGYSHRLQKINTGLVSLSMAITWLLETSIETSHSMTARGYGLKRRSSFHLYVWTKPDILIQGLLLFLGSYFLFGFRHFQISYYPVIAMASINPYRLSLLIAFATVCLLPSIIDLREEFKWKQSQSKI